MTSLYACDCVRLHMHVIQCVCVWHFGMKFFLGGKNVKPKKNLFFFKKGRMVIAAIV